MFHSVSPSFANHVSQVSQIRVLASLKVSQIPFSQFYGCFARFASFRKYEVRKVSHFSVSQEFANRFFVSQVLQGFCNWQFADIKYTEILIRLHIHVQNIQKRALPTSSC